MADNRLPSALFDVGINQWDKAVSAAVLTCIIWMKERIRIRTQCDANNQSWKLLDDLLVYTCSSIIFPGSCQKHLHFLHCCTMVDVRYFYLIVRVNLWRKLWYSFKQCKIKIFVTALLWLSTFPNSCVCFNSHFLRFTLGKVSKKFKSWWNFPWRGVWVVIRKLEIFH